MQVQSTMVKEKDNNQSEGVTMSRPYKPAGAPGLMPYLTVPNATQALNFYQDAFGFKLDSEPMRKGDEIQHAQMFLHDTKIMFAPEGAWDNERFAPNTNKTLSPIALYVYVEDVDATFEHAKKMGAQVIDPPEETFWGDRMCRLKDPFGYDWSFATNVKDVDPNKSPF